MTRQPAELVTAFVTAPFLVQKALKTANSEKFVFSCQTASGMPECHRLSPLRHRSLLGRKVRKSGQVPEDFVLGKFESIMERADSLMGKVGSLMPGRRWVVQRQLRQGST